MQVVPLLALALQQTDNLTRNSQTGPLPIGADGRFYLWIALAVAVVALGLAFLLARAVIASDSGTAEMQAISNAIREGAEAFLKRRWWCLWGITCRHGQLRMRARR
jgi:K(+)-stimulated pyrophosphate-energized sodium pump